MDRAERIRRNPLFEPPSVEEVDRAKQRIKGFSKEQLRFTIHDTPSLRAEHKAACELLEDRENDERRRDARRFWVLAALAFLSVLVSAAHFYSR